MNRKAGEGPLAPLADYAGPIRWIGNGICGFAVFVLVAGTIAMLTSDEGFDFTIVVITGVFFVIGLLFRFGANKLADGDGPEMPVVFAWGLHGRGWRHGCGWHRVGHRRSRRLRAHGFRRRLPGGGMVRPQALRHARGQEGGLRPGARGGHSNLRRAHGDPARRHRHPCRRGRRCGGDRRGAGRVARGTAGGAAQLGRRPRRSDGPAPGRIGLYRRGPLDCLCRGGVRGGADLE